LSLDPLAAVPLDLRAAKEAAGRLFTPSHPLRLMLDHEPDMLDRTEALAKIESWLRLLSGGR